MRKAPSLVGHMDILVAVTLGLVAALAFALLPEGSTLRLLLAMPMLFFVPGYLLIQAFAVPAAPRKERAVHGLFAVGVSPAVVGLLAFSTSLLPGGFRPVSIVVMVTLGVLAFATVAVMRRLSAHKGDGIAVETGSGV